jgi:lipopolysaccharide export system permease protein
MSLLFAVLMTYGRLSSDSEIVAMKASGLSMTPIALPAIFLATAVALLSGYTSFYLAPWGNRQFELLVTKVGQTKASITIREGTFSEGFFDKVVYANHVNTKTGELQSVFIYDETQGDVPLTIIAKRGEIIQDAEVPNSVLVRLFDGDIHRKGESHTKIKFESYDLKMTDQVPQETREKSLPSLTIQEISTHLNKALPGSEEWIGLKSEYHKRWAIAILCLIFGFLGVALGTNTNRRSQKKGGLVLSIVVIISYWILYVACEGAARNGSVHPAIAIWLPNLLFGGFTIRTLIKNWN